MSTDIKVSKDQLLKIIQSKGFLGNMIGQLSTEALIKFAIQLAKDILPQLATKVTSSIIDNFDRDMRGSGTEAGVLRARKGLTCPF